MSDFNQQHNRAVWFDIPVVDLERAIAFYSAVLAIDIHKESHEGVEFAVLDHEHGNGGCLVPKPEEISDSGLVLYLNAEGRLRDAVAQVDKLGGTVLQPVSCIEPNGFIAIVLDSEGNRIGLHSSIES